MLPLASPGPCLPLPVVVVTGPPGEEPAKYLGELPPPPAKYLLQVGHLHNTTKEQQKHVACLHLTVYSLAIFSQEFPKTKLRTKLPQ